MKLEEIAVLTDQELLEAAKKAKKAFIFDAVVVGMLAGIAIYSSVNNGFGLLTFLPLVYVPIAGRNTLHKQAVDKEVAERGLG
ncbi:MAG: FUSC family protein [Bacteroidota bacterium]